MWFHLLKYLYASIVLYPFCGCSVLCEKGSPTIQNTVFCRADILISKQHSYSCYFSNVVVGTICWYERHGDALHGIHSPLVTFCLTFSGFWLILNVKKAERQLNNNQH